MPDRDPNTWDPNDGSGVLRPEHFGPKCWDPPSQDPNEGSKIPGPIKRSEVRGPKYLDVNMVTNVHVWTKLTVGTSEHSFKSIDEDW